MGALAGATGILELCSGTLRVRTIEKMAQKGQSEVYFDGGTMQACANETAWLQNINKAETREGGAVFDTDGNDAAIAQNIAHDTREDAAAKDGGLTKNGTGTLTMTGSLGFTGDLAVNAGTLNLSAANYSHSQAV